jgi:hypothetical protein
MTSPSLGQLLLLYVFEAAPTGGWPREQRRTLCVGSAEWDMECVSVAMATKCQGVELLCIWDGYEVVRDPVDNN